jgi:3-oxoacyl-[acyl-carrier protein] reductase
MDFTGKKVLLTGATGGIGQAILKAFITAGATVVASGTRAEVLNDICREVGEKAIPITCNLRDIESIKNLCSAAVESMGTIDILICNAGITKDNLSMMMKIDDWNDVINVNLTATFLLNQLVSKVMLKQKFGRVINIASVVASTGNPGQANYVASKAGMIGFTKSMADEFASRNITFNCIAPGFIESPMTDKLNDTQKEQIAKKIPMGRMGTGEEIAYGALFLASDQSSYITGHTLNINGGLFKA